MTQDDGELERASSMAERMRALLAHAAEEQLGESRQLTAVLADLRQLVVDVDERLRALEERSGRLAAQVADLVVARQTETLVPQTTAAVLDGVADRVGPPVRQAAERTEQRLTAHVDEAVLALAEALLRRRRAPTTTSDTGATPPDS